MGLRALIGLIRAYRVLRAHRVYRVHGSKGVHYIGILFPCSLLTSSKFMIVDFGALQGLWLRPCMFGVFGLQVCMFKI